MKFQRVFLSEARIKFKPGYAARNVIISYKWRTAFSNSWIRESPHDLKEKNLMERIFICDSLLKRNITIHFGKKSR